MSNAVWRVRGRDLDLDLPLVMGIVNVTPDSFSDGGSLHGSQDAISLGRQMIADGAAVVDVGGESTRPGAETISAGEELDRVLPVVEGLSGSGAVVSIDTSKAEVAAACIEAGAHIVNDVTALGDPDMADVCAASDVGVVLMHMPGNPRTMQSNAHYGDVVADVARFLADRATSALARGIDKRSIVVDPGVGFGKSVHHNIELIRGVRTLSQTGYPVLVGASRKGFLGSILSDVRGETMPRQRDSATLAAVALSVYLGASIVRVHNVRAAVDVALTANAMVPVEGYDQEIDWTRTEGLPLGDQGSSGGL